MPTNVGFSVLLFPIYLMVRFCAQGSKGFMGGH